MYDAIANKQGNLLIIQYSGSVNREETGKCVKLVRELIQGLKPGFTVITDLGRLSHMDFDCAEDLGTVMDMCNQAGVAHIRRVVPNPEADIGWSILSRFHYNEEDVNIKTYPTFYQAMKTLILEDKIEIRESPAGPTQ